MGLLHSTNNREKLKKMTIKNRKIRKWKLKFLKLEKPVWKILKNLLNKTLKFSLRKQKLKQQMNLNTPKISIIKLALIPV